VSDFSPRVAKCRP